MSRRAVQKANTEALRREGSPMSTPDFSTCDLCDAHKSAADDVALRVLPPVFRSYGGRRRFSGPVSTVKCFEDNSVLKAAVESPGAGRVLVVAGGGSQRCALLGGNLAATAARNGWAGVVVDGCVRDAAEMADCDIGILALGLVPLASTRRNEGQRDLPLHCQGVQVRPGDWFYADDDGAILASRPLS